MILKKIPFTENAVTQNELQIQLAEYATNDKIVLSNDFSIEKDAAANQLKLKYAGQLLGAPVDMSGYLTAIPTASQNTLGGVKIFGNNLTIDEHGVLSAASGGGAEYSAGNGIAINDYMISLTATIPTKTSELQNDSNFLTEHQPLTAYYTKTEIDQKIGDINTILDQINGEVY